MLTYTLITAARNEAGYIEKTLHSVERQTVPPRRWIIVSDGSTDATDAIVAAHANEHAFIELHRTTREGDRSFGSKARAVNDAYRRIASVQSDLVGILDADISFGPDYYERLLAHFAEAPSLGVGGGYPLDFYRGRFIRHHYSTQSSVRGPVQTFRRACFEDIEGYRPLTYGGVDAVAEVMARMHGWEVRTFTDLTVYHHRTTGSQAQHLLRAQIRLGHQNYVAGYHPLFMLARCLRRALHRPYLVTGPLMLAGYIQAKLQHEPRQVPPEFVAFLQHEQMKRLFGKRAEPKKTA